jgi:hypothetical protein
LLITSCTTIEYVKVPTVVPVTILEAPVLPTITPEQEASIPNEVYVELSAREETLIQHIETQKAIILVHNRSSISEDEER